MENKMNIEVKKLPNAQIELLIKTNSEDFKEATARAYAKLSPNTKIKGFREGKAPKQLILEYLGTKLYDEALNLLLINSTQKALIQEKLTPIDSPKFDIIKFDPNEETHFTVTFSVYPNIKLGNIKDIKVDSEDIKKAKKEKERIEKESKTKKSDKKEIEEKKDKDDDIEKKEEDKFNLDQYYSKIIDEIIKISEFEIPDVLITNELSYQEETFIKRLEELGIKVEEYLKLQNTDFEKLRKTWKDSIIFTLKQDLLLTEFARENKIDIAEDELESIIKEVYPNENYEKIDPNTKNYVKFNYLKQKSFLELIKIIEKENVDTNNN